MDVVEPFETAWQVESEAESANIRQAHPNIRIAKVEPIERSTYEEHCNIFQICGNDSSVKSGETAILEANDPLEETLLELPAKSLKCYICSDDLNNNDDLQQHMEAVHRRSLKCLHCEQFFSRKGPLVKHLKAHQLESTQIETCSSPAILIDPIFCVICDLWMKSNDKVADHMAAHQSDGPFECPDCADLFEDIKVFQDHITNHNVKAKKVPGQITDPSSSNASNNTDAVIEENKITPPSSPIEQSFSDNEPIASYPIESNLCQRKNIHTTPRIEQTKIAPVSSSLITSQSDVRLESASLHNETFADEPNANIVHKEEQNENSLHIITLEKPDNNTRPFTCDQCDRTFTLAKTLALHIRHSHQKGERIYNCEHCDQSFSQKRNILKHMKIHTKGLSKCKYCDHEFRLGTIMVHHLKQHEGEHIFPCPHCSIPYSSLNYLNLHVKRMHTSSFTCVSCDKKFSTHSALNRHSRKHAVLFPYPCKVCGKSFTDRTLLKSHQIIHNGTKSFQCSYCGQSFSYAGNLKVHVRIHTGERPYKCKVCHKTFARTPNLKEHMQTHTGQKHIKCEVCGKDFASATTFCKHKKIHTGERPYKCHICQNTFRQSIHLRKHIMVHTGEKPFPCEVCGRFFRRKDALQIHVKRHHVRIHQSKKPAQKVKENSRKNVQEIKEEEEAGNSVSAGERMKSGGYERSVESEEDTTGVLQEIKIEIVDDLWL